MSTHDSNPDIIEQGLENHRSTIVEDTSTVMLRVAVPSDDAPVVSTVSSLKIHTTDRRGRATKFSTAEDHILVSEVKTAKAHVALYGETKKLYS